MDEPHLDLTKPADCVTDWPKPSSTLERGMWVLSRTGNNNKWICIFCREIKTCSASRVSDHLKQICGGWKSCKAVHNYELGRKIKEDLIKEQEAKNNASLFVVYFCLFVYLFIFSVGPDLKGLFLKFKQKYKKIIFILTKKGCF